jgi:Ca2+-binding RTX toxin-like protein
VSATGLRLSIVGSDFADDITGGDENDAVDAGQGDDSVHTGAGNDDVQQTGSGSGDDVVDLGPGEDSYYLASGAATVEGGADTDTFYDQSGGDRGRVALTGFESATLTGLVDGDSASSSSLSWDVRATAASAIDLGADTVTEGGRTGHFAVGGEPFFTGLGDTTVTGTSSSDSILVSSNSGSSLTANLLGGADHLASSGFHSGTADLGDGDDLVTGTYVGMELDGGLGTDTLDLAGGSGNTCTGFESGACNPG